MATMLPPMIAFSLIFMLTGMVRAGDFENWAERTLKCYSSGVSRFNMEALPQTQCTEEDVDGNKIKFYLFTRAVPWQNELRLKANHTEEALIESTYNMMKPTKILIHGWLQNSADFHDLVADYLIMQNVNVITVDWSAYSKTCNLNSTVNVVVPVTGKYLARLMKALIDYGGNSTKFHQIGFGISSHIAGIAGKRLSPWRIGRITALDPLGYEFDCPGKTKLQNGDAYFVDIIHTSQPFLGTSRKIGDIAFYPNGGTHPQPGISDEDIMGSSFMSLLYFKRTIGHPNAFVAEKCNDWLEYRQSRCTYSLSSVMGEYINFRDKGDFFVEADARDLMNNTSLLKYFQCPPRHE